MKRQDGLLATLALAMLLLASGCTLLKPAEETPTPVPAGNQLVLTAPYRAVLNEDNIAPGAQLQYVSQDDDGIHVRIDGLDATKKVGDSFNWSGSPAAGVELDYNLRVMGVYLGVFQAWGDVKISVADPAPVVDANTPEDAPLIFSAAVATYAVRTGEMVPGTTYSYLGKTDKGAEFGGVEGYPYRDIADSLDWAGRLRDNVYVDLIMRVSSIQDDEVTLIGTATVWIWP